MPGFAPAELAVMIPVYNEARTLPTILDHVLARPEVAEVIAIDDGSSDSSWEILVRYADADPRLRCFRQPRNEGKGAAIRLAISKLTAGYAMIQDADLEYDPSDYPALLQPLLAGMTDVVFGVRGFAGQTAYSFWFVTGNKLVTLATNILFDCYISDMETGYKLLSTDLWRQLRLSSAGFDIEPEITAKVLRLGYRIHEVPIHYYARSRSEGKKLTWRDGVSALGALLRFRVSTKSVLFGAVDETYHDARRLQMAARHPLVIREPSPQTPGRTDQTGASQNPREQPEQVPGDRIP